ncbi:MAG: hypothetical protein J6P62_01295 [Bacteroidales bacterium]|nr:hypothetical protein [Bacteroidales bacterium]
MGFQKFINSLKNFGDTISSAADSVFDEVNKTFNGLDTSKLTPEQEKEIERKLEEKVTDASEKADDAADTFLGEVKRGLILLERDDTKEETDEES